MKKFYKGLTPLEVHISSLLRIFCKRIRLRLISPYKHSSALKPLTGFTLMEIAVTLVITSVLLSITFSLFALNKDFWSLKQKTFLFAKNFNNAKKLSLQGLTFSEKKICGSGLLIDKNGYIGIAVDVSDPLLLNCSKIETNFLNLTEEDNIETNENFVKISKFFNFTTDYKEILKEKFELVKISFYKDEVSDLSKIEFDKLEILFVNPYADPVVFKLLNGISEKIDNWDKLIFVLQFNNESSEIKITKTGQIIFK